jgi:transposase
MKDFLTPTQVIEYRKRHRKEKNKRSADRIKIILALNSGYSYEEVAALFLLDDETIRRHEKSFLESGLDGLLKVDYKGSNSLLSIEDEIKIKNHLNENIYLSTKEVSRYIYNTFAIRYTCSGTRDLLKRLGFVYKKPECIPSKADRAEQSCFIDSFIKLKNKKSKNDPIYFIDATHPTHNTKPAYGWILRGEKKEIKTNSGRQRININGALSIEKREIIIDETETVNAQSTIRLFSKILNKNKNSKKVYIVADNAGYYHSKILQGWLQNNKKIKMIYLPPYSPNLNLIERLWKYMHKKVTYNKYYEKYSVFRREVIMFFNMLTNSWESDLDTLLAENFSPIGR